MKTILLTFTDFKGKVWEFGEFANASRRRYYLTDGWKTEFPLLRKGLRGAGDIVTYEVNNMRIPSALKQLVKNHMISSRD